MWCKTEIATIGTRLLAWSVSVMLWLYGMRRRALGEAGQSMVEYAIVVALVAIIAMVGIQAFGQGVTQVFQHLLSKIQGIGS